jgi:hypothetical protein
MQLDCMRLVKMKSSTFGSSIFFDSSKPKSIEFTEDFVVQKFQHKESNFKCLISDRSTKNYTSENMQRRRCVSSTQ